MQNLYNQLTSPIISYNDKGEQVQSAPTAVMLRAANVLKQLVDTNDQNNTIIQSLQLGSQQNFEIIEQLRKEIESLQQSRGQTSGVGGARTYTTGSDSTSKTGDQPLGSDPSPH